MNKSIILVVSILFLTFSCKSHKKITDSKKHKYESNKGVVTPKKESKNSNNQNDKSIKEIDDRVEVVASKSSMSNAEQYIVNYKEFAIEQMHKYGIPASIILAQGISESASGKSRLALEANNHFGIKCHNSWKGKKIYHTDDAENECFRKYNNAIESIEDHSLFLKNRKRYSSLFLYESTDYVSWAVGLKESGYATDPRYSDKLINIINRYGLDSYDKKIQRVQKARYVYVQKKETLYSISKKYNISVEHLKQINSLTSDSLSIGQRLLISGY